MHESSGPSENNTLTEPVSRVRDKHTSRQWRRCKFRGIGSSSVSLIIIWTFAMSFLLNTALRVGFSDYLKGVTVKELEGEYAFCSGCISTSIKSTSRGGHQSIQTVKYSLRVMWFLSIVSCALTITGYSLPTATSTLFIFRLFVNFLPLPILGGAFLASAIPLGIDQIISGPSDSISAFIQWMVWASALGCMFSNALRFVTHRCTHYQDTNHQVIMLYSPAPLLSIGLLRLLFRSQTGPGASDCQSCHSHFSKS